MYKTEIKEIPRKDYTYHLPKQLNKTKTVAWIVDTCRSRGRREDYAHQLAKYIDVDIYGKCGFLDCPENSDCLRMLEKEYMFYLAFEDAVCPDYMTDESYRILNYDMVPIVFGGGDYRNRMPPDSYLNAWDYQNPEDLAQYLLKLKNNKSKYYKYLYWKEKYSVKTNNWLCDVCKMLNEKTQTKVYQDIYRWWSSQDNKCKWWPNYTIKKIKK